MNTKQRLLEIYCCLYRYYGPQNWWPAETPFEVIIGAILTQSAAWTNVEKGIANLKQVNALIPDALRALSHDELARLIHPCGYYNAKAIKLKAFTNWLGERFDDDVDKMFTKDPQTLRKDLLEVHGIGEETADSIMLYAGNKPIFVIDTYTRRIIDRIGLKTQGQKYIDYQNLFVQNLPEDSRMFNEFHALFVALGKEACRKQPACEKCCLRDMCLSASSY